MTIEEFIVDCEHDGSYVPINEVLRLMKEYAKHCCQLQRQICADNADVDYTIIKHDDGGEDMIEVYVIKDSIFNAPEPETQ